MVGYTLDTSGHIFCTNAIYRRETDQLDRYVMPQSFHHSKHTLAKLNIGGRFILLSETYVLTASNRSSWNVDMVIERERPYSSENLCI